LTPPVPEDALDALALLNCWLIWEANSTRLALKATVFTFEMLFPITSSHVLWA
jgi:hypothetical protein